MGQHQSSRVMFPYAKVKGKLATMPLYANISQLDRSTRFASSFFTNSISTLQLPYLFWLVQIEKDWS